MSDFNRLIEFINLTIKFRGVERGVHMLHENRKENDAEHSFQLAIVAWYIASHRNLNLDTNKILKYALAHDLIESYAGDTPVLTATPEMFASKIEREHQAHVQLRKEFPDFTEAFDSIHAYEDRIDDEAKLVYALDKLLPAVLVYLDDGHSWKINNAKLSKIINHKVDKIALSPVIKEYFDELVEILTKNEKKYFN